MTKTKVLIVDDEKENIRYLTTILEENGFRSIFSAADGDEGLKRTREVMPGLIVLDVRMPRKSGIQMFNELRKIWKYKDIPVIILTGEGEFLKQLTALREFHEGSSLSTDKPTAEVLGRFIHSQPEAFLEKPIAPEAFMAAVRKVLTR